MPTETEIVQTSAPASTSASDTPRERTPEELDQALVGHLRRNRGLSPRAPVSTRDSDLRAARIDSAVFAFWRSLTHSGEFRPEVQVFDRTGRLTLDESDHTAGRIVLPFTSPETTLPGAKRWFTVFDEELGRTSRRHTSTVFSREIRQPRRLHVCAGCSYGKHDRRQGREAAYNLCTYCHSTYGKIPTDIYNLQLADLSKRGLIESPARSFTYDGRFARIAEMMRAQWRGRNMVFGVSAGKEYEVPPYSEIRTRLTISGTADGRPWIRRADSVPETETIETLRPVLGTYPKQRLTPVDLVEALGGGMRRTEDDMMLTDERAYRTANQIWVSPDDDGLATFHAVAADAPWSTNSRLAGDFTDQSPFAIRRPRERYSAVAQDLIDSGLAPKLPPIKNFTRGLADPRFSAGPQNEILTEHARRTFTTAEALAAARSALVSRDWDEALHDDRAWDRRREATLEHQIKVVEKAAVLGDWTDARRKREIAFLKSRWNPEHFKPPHERRRVSPFEATPARTITTRPSRLFHTGVDEALGRKEQNRFLEEHNARVRSWLADEMGVSEKRIKQFERAYPLNPETEREDILPRDADGKAVPRHRRLKDQGRARKQEAANWRRLGGALSTNEAAASIEAFRAATTPVDYHDLPALPGSRASGLRVDRDDELPSFDAALVRAELATLPGVEGQALDVAVEWFAKAHSAGIAAAEEAVASMVWSDFPMDPDFTSEERQALQRVERDLRQVLGLPEFRLDEDSLANTVAGLPLDARDRNLLAADLRAAAAAGPASLEWRIDEALTELGATVPPTAFDGLLAAGEPRPQLEVSGSEASGLTLDGKGDLRDITPLTRQIESWDWIKPSDAASVTDSLSAAAASGPDSLAGSIAEVVWRDASDDSAASRRAAEQSARQACGLRTVRVDTARLAETLDTLPNWGHLSERERHALHHDVVNAAKAGPGALERAVSAVVEAGVPFGWDRRAAWADSARLALQASLGEPGVLRRERGETVEEIREIRTVEGVASIQPAYVVDSAARRRDALDSLWAEGALIEAHQEVRSREIVLQKEADGLQVTSRELQRAHGGVVTSGREFLGQLGGVVADPRAFQRVLRDLLPEQKRGVLNTMQHDPRSLEARVGPAGKLATAPGGATPDERAVRAAPAVARHGHVYLDGTTHYRDMITAAAERLGLADTSTRSTVRAEVDSRISATDAKLAELKAERSKLGPEPERGAAFNRVSQLNASEQRLVVERFPRASALMKEVSRSRLVVVFDRRRSSRQTIVDHSGRHQSIKERARGGQEL
jgi:hypothetical protein